MDIIKRALKERLVDIGQLSKQDRAVLNAAVKRGVLSKGKGGPYPNTKTVYAEPGYNFEEERKNEVRELFREMEYMEKMAKRRNDRIRKKNFF